MTLHLHYQQNPLHFIPLAVCLVCVLKCFFFKPIENISSVRVVLAFWKWKWLGLSYTLFQSLNKASAAQKGGVHFIVCRSNINDLSRSASLSIPENSHHVCCCWIEIQLSNSPAPQNNLLKAHCSIMLSVPFPLQDCLVTVSLDLPPLKEESVKCIHRWPTLSLKESIQF